TQAPSAYPADWLSRRVKDDALRARLAALDLKDETALFGLYLAGADDLRTFAGPGPLNSDDHPLVAAEAPRAAYAIADTPAARLVTLLSALQPHADEVMRGADATGQRQLSDYWRARDRFLAIGAHTLAYGNPRNIIAEIAPQLIEVVRMSGDFDAAYMP